MLWKQSSKHAASDSEPQVHVGKLFAAWIMSSFEPTQNRTKHYQYISMWDNIHYKVFLLFRLLDTDPGKGHRKQIFKTLSTYLKL